MAISKNGPGRPRAFDQQVALAAAMRLFWRQGCAATSVPDISSATGLSTSSLYNAFGSKLELLEAVLAYYHDTVLDRFMLGPMLRGTEGLVDLERFFARLAEAAELDPPRGCLAVNMIAELRDPPAGIARQTARYRGLLREALRAALTRAAAEGEIPADGVDRRVDGLVPMVLAYNLLVSARAPATETLALLDCLRRIATGPAG